jgi:cyclopropane-fatty-acyl-phospholipid synthase
MATQEQVGSTYNFIDDIFRMSLGEMADFSGAMYDGDFSKTLHQAQQDKHDYILRNLNITSRSRVLDIGCGWGPMLNAIRNIGARGIGVTLSTAQAASCRRQGLEAHVLDWKDMDVATFGKFDAIVSLGAFEHFCSKDESLAGEQDRIYDRFFKLCNNLLEKNGRLYLQTMLFGRKVPATAEISKNAPRGSDAWMVWLLEKTFPGSWLPYGEQHVLRTAAPYFDIISMKNGRLDYIETIGQWNKRMNSFSFRKLMKVLGFVRHFFTDKNFLYRLEGIVVGPNRECFKREILDHQRMVFAKKD